MQSLVEPLDRSFIFSELLGISAVGQLRLSLAVLAHPFWSAHKWVILAHENRSMNGSL